MNHKFSSNTIKNNIGRDKIGLGSLRSDQVSLTLKGYNKRTASKSKQQSNQRMQAYLEQTAIVGQQMQRPLKHNKHLDVLKSGNID